MSEPTIPAGHRNAMKERKDWGGLIFGATLAVLGLAWTATHLLDGGLDGLVAVGVAILVMDNCQRGRL